MVDSAEVLAALDAIDVYQRTGHPWTLERGPAEALAAAGRLRARPETVRAALASNQSLHIADAIGWFGIGPERGIARILAAGALDFREDFGRGFLAAFDRRDRPNRTAIAVDTIHAAKGREAPAVVLHTGYLKARSADYWRDPAIAAEERRVYYVGITRASSHLAIVDSLRSGPSAPPMQAIPGVRA
jgi:superfamily I DNA/RNA helicase